MESAEVLSPCMELILITDIADIALGCLRDGFQAAEVLDGICWIEEKVIGIVEKNGVAVVDVLANRGISES